MNPSQNGTLALDRSREVQALAFIRTEKKEGRSPGMRKIANAADFKSSRSGAKLHHALRRKGFQD